MLNLFANIRRCEKGDVLVEFAAALPMMVLLFVGVSEMGRAFLQANAVEKGMRAAAVYAARVDDPLALGSRTIIENIVKTGTVDGSGSFLVEGWGKAGSTLAVVQSFYNLDGNNVPVITLNASVPYEPMVPQIANLFGLENYTITLSHEQAYVDN